MTKLENVYDESRHFFYIDTEKAMDSSAYGPAPPVVASFRFMIPNACNSISSKPKSP
jgi:hypothetical protein